MVEHTGAVFPTNRANQGSVVGATFESIHGVDVGRDFFGLGVGSETPQPLQKQNGPEDQAGAGEISTDLVQHSFLPERKTTPQHNLVNG